MGFHHSPCVTRWQNTASATSAQDMLSTPLFWGDDAAGRRVFVFVYKDGAAFGFDEEVFAEMQELTEHVLKSDWARRTLSRSFVLIGMGSRRRSAS